MLIVSPSWPRIVPLYVVGPQMTIQAMAQAMAQVQAMAMAMAMTQATTRSVTVLRLSSTDWSKPPWKIRWPIGFFRAAIQTRIL